MIDWGKITLADTKVISAIVKRAVAFNDEVDPMTANMDISAAHISRPLNLRDLLASGDLNFTHDVFGIMRHINRETGELEDFFVPRYSM